MNGMTCTSIYAMVILEHKSVMTQLCHSILSKKAERIDSSGSYQFRCRQDNSLLWDLPTESSFMGQIISSGLHHFRLFFLHTKLSKDISGTGNLDPSLIVDVFLNQDYSGDSNGGICVI